MHNELKKFLQEHLYKHEYVIRMTRDAASVIKTLFEAYTGNPDLLPGDIRSKYTLRTGTDVDETIQREVADYIAGMTDRFAFTEFERITGKPAVTH